MKRLITFILLQNKRLLKRPGFIAIFLLVPFFVLFMTGVSKMDTDILKIAVFAGEDKLAVEAVNQLESPESVIKFIMVDSEDEAISLVSNGKVNASWVFAEDYSSAINDCLRYGEARTLVTSYQPEDNPLLSIALFRLNVVMYPQYMYEAYKDYTKDAPVSRNYTDEEIEAFFENNKSDLSLFEMKYLDSNEKVDTDTGYLAAPLRGILALWLMLTAFAAVLYYIYDEKNGMFERTPLKYRPAVGAVYIGVPVFDAAFVMLITLVLTGNSVFILREVMNLLILCINSVLFAGILKRVLKTTEKIAVAIPVVMLIMLVLCPVFITVKDMRFLQWLLPPFFYLNATHAMIYTVYSVILMISFCCVNTAVVLYRELMLDKE